MAANNNLETIIKTETKNSERFILALFFILLLGTLFLISRDLIEKGDVERWLLNLQTFTFEKKMHVGPSLEISRLKERAINRLRERGACHGADTPITLLRFNLISNTYYQKDPDVISMQYVCLDGTPLAAIWTPSTDIMTGLELKLINENDYNERNEIAP